MWFPKAIPFLGLTASQQVPFQAPSTAMTANRNFSFVQGANVFSPHDLVQLVRPSAAVANHAGDLILVTLSKYDPESKENKQTAFIKPAVASSSVKLEIALAKGAQLFWLDGADLAQVLEVDGKLDLSIIPLAFEPPTANSEGSLEAKAAVPIGSLPTTTATNFRYSVTGGYLVFSDEVFPDGKLETIAEQDKEYENRGTSGLVYDETFVRHWDHWVGPKVATLFSVTLQKDPDFIWHLGTKFTNLLHGTGHSSPVAPFGGTDDFDISSTHVVYTSKDPKLPQAMHTKQNVYIVDIEGSGKPVELTSGKQGATHSPVLNHQSTKAAWLELDKDGYESDRAKIVIYDLVKHVRFTLTQAWDRSPDTLAFSKEGDVIYFTGGDHARVKTFALPIPPTPEKSTTDPKLERRFTKPVVITEGGAASGIQALFYGRILLSISSLTAPNDAYLVSGLRQLESDLQETSEPLNFQGHVDRLTHFSEESLKDKGLNPGEEFWFKGGDDLDVQGWIVKPAGWEKDQKKKYPAVLLIHGGPQGAWEDQWSNRWNPNVFSAQGYFTVMINPTGSTTFGQDFTDAIASDWGGRPFVDLQKGWKYILNEYPEIDQERTVAAGASWGGYAINWIQAHPEFGFGFKALVCHDGVFDTAFNGLSTDELFFFNHEWGGRPWDKKSKALSQQYSPSNFIHKFSTPQLLIHGSKDYRLAETESISAFHALQQLGIRSRLLIFPDENHWVLKHGNSLKWHYEVFRWFDEFVGEK